MLTCPRMNSTPPSKFALLATTTVVLDAPGRPGRAQPSRFVPHDGEIRLHLRSTPFNRAGGTEHPSTVRNPESTSGPATTQFWETSAAATAHTTSETRDGHGRNYGGRTGGDSETWGPDERMRVWGVSPRRGEWVS